MVRVILSGGVRRRALRIGECGGGGGRRGWVSSPLVYLACLDHSSHLALGFRRAILNGGTIQRVSILYNHRFQVLFELRATERTERMKQDHVHLDLFNPTTERSKQKVNTLPNML